MFALAGSFIIVAGWNWYHLAYRPHWRFVVISLAMWIFVFVGFQFFKFIFAHLAKRYKRHPYWQTEFIKFLDKLFFIFSLIFLIFFSRSEIISFVWVSFIFLILFWRLHDYLARHPAAGPWLIVNRSFFLLGYFIFVLCGAFQYFAYKYYILDSNVKFYNIVIFRSWAMTMFWLFGFAIAGFIYWQFKSRLRYIALFFWAVLFVAIMFLWSLDVGILIFSGLHFSPFMLSQAEGAGGIIFSKFNILLMAIFVFLLIVFLYTFKKIIKAHNLAPRRYWYYYNFSIIVVAVMSFLSVASFKNTPEYLMAKSFYQYFMGKTEKVELNPIVKEKLERFGLHYNTDEFYVARKDKVYRADKILLPEKFQNTKPNVIIIFLESFSSRLTGVYNPQYTDLTPSLNEMAKDKNTTIFKKYFNSSTPTITALMSQLCSFLPPTGHDEIEGQKHLQRHYLLCLPEILKNNGGFQYTNYITAVAKDYASKDTILASMGIDNIFGTEELAKLIKGEPMAWGYSDHQMFPVLGELMQKNRAKEPFFMALSTVDTHPPFTLVKDVIEYKDGKNNLLNTIHTTDNAFGLFWRQFVNSEFYNNTIVIAVADHAVFPTAYTADTMPKGVKNMNYYDELFFTMYAPDSVLPKEVDMYSSGLDLTPTLLQMLSVNVPNSFEGHSIFDDREKYPNVLGMHEFGFYINQIYPDGARKGEYNIPVNLQCTDADLPTTSAAHLTFCDFMNFYNWKRSMFEEGRFWGR